MNALRRRAFAFLAISFIGAGAWAESLDFAIHRHGNGVERVAAGKRDYTLADIDVMPWGKPEGGQQSLKKSLALHEGFRIGMVVARQHATSGFGLWISHDDHPDGFSWEWFAHEQGTTYRKSGGAGRVRVTFATVPGGVEVAAVEFLTDVTLRFKSDPDLPPGHITHEVVVSKGSVLRLGA